MSTAESFTAQAQPSSPPECDVLLFVATKLEVEAVRAAADDLQIPVEEQTSAMGVYWKLGTLGERRVLAVKTSTGALSPKGSAANARYYLDVTGASSLIYVGMAFGIDRASQKVGDVLVSKHVFPYDDRFVRDDGASSWRYDYEQRGLRMYQAKPDLIKMIERFQLREGKGQRISTGCILTGSALIQSRRYRDHLVEQCARAAKNIIGGEMEGVGLLGLDAREKCRWLIAKGISDFADGDELSTDEMDANKRSACRNAAQVVLQALKTWTPVE